MIKISCIITLALTLSAQAGVQVSHIYKVLTSDQLTVLKESGEFAGAPVDIADGYIHMSTKDQYEGVIERYFAGIRPIYVVSFNISDYEKYIKWELASNGEEFPHIYDYSLKKVDVVSIDER